MRPMFEMLSGNRDRLSLHMPGHKGKAPFGPVDVYQLDTTETPLTDDLYAPEKAIAEAQRLYAQAAGAGESFFLHGGSTAGIHTMLMYAAQPGDTVILPRNAHLSAVNACVLGGLKPVFAPCTLTADGYAYVKEETLLETIRSHPEAKAVLVTRPDYYGCAMPLKQIAAEAHRLGMRLVVDEAHGAHLPFMKANLSAGAQGADLWVQSAHKTLPCLTGAAVLHIQPHEDGSRVLRMLRMVQTSSPSFILMMALDDARAFMADKGREHLDRIARRADEISSRLGDPRRQWHGPDWFLDPTRLVLPGDSAAQKLEAAGIDVEMHDDHRAVCILSVMDDQATFDRLNALLEKEPLPPSEPRKLMPMGQFALPPRQAAMGQSRWLPLEEAAGRIAACAAGLYPPGVPLVNPGERYTQAIIDRLCHARPQNTFGLWEGRCACVEE